MAKPSFIQISLQSSGETELPSHWWAASWAMMPGPMVAGPWMESVWFSSASPSGNGITMVP